MGMHPHENTWQMKFFFVGIRKKQTKQDMDYKDSAPRVVMQFVFQLAERERKHGQSLWRLYKLKVKIMSSGQKDVESSDLEFDAGVLQSFNTTFDIRAVD